MVAKHGAPNGTTQTAFKVLLGSWGGWGQVAVQIEQCVLYLGPQSLLGPSELTQASCTEEQRLNRVIVGYFRKCGLTC